MNCKPGDLAIVVGSSQYAGKLVEVLYAAPMHHFTLPDGYPHEPERPDVWVLRILGCPLKAPLMTNGIPNGKYRLARYGCGRDSKLRPIRGEPLMDEEREKKEITA